jgi:D-beta-D-heptose 7-phosphate kinase / D-beta-D-heptose 1-phosphate adenosyltransferase
MKKELAGVVPHLKRLLPGLRKLRVAVLGDLMLDRYLWGTAHRLSPEAAVPVVDFESQNDFLGGAGNVAANLAALGAQVQVFGVIGGRELTPDKIADDEAGTALRGCLRRDKIGERGVLADAQRITTVKTRVVARHQQIVRIDQERNDVIAPETEEQLFRRLRVSLNIIDALLVSDYDKGLITDAFAERVLNACHKCKVPVFVKPKKSRLFTYRGAHVIVCNTEEASFYVTRPLRDERSFEEAGRALLARFGSNAVVITRGRKGMSLFEESKPRYLTIPATSFEVTYARVGQPGVQREGSGRQVFDVTGAGDTVLSVLSLAVTAGASLPEATYLANTAAGVVVGKLGTATVNRAELAAALDETRS